MLPKRNDRSEDFVVLLVAIGMFGCFGFVTFIANGKPLESIGALVIVLLCIGAVVIEVKRK